MEELWLVENLRDAPDGRWRVFRLIKWRIRSMEARMSICFEVPCEISKFAVPTATFLGDSMNLPLAPFCGFLEFFGNKQASSVLLLLNRYGAALAMCIRSSLVFRRHLNGAE